MSKSKHICIVQITRIGDLLQTYQACSNLKKNIPNLELSLVARKKFASPLLFLLEGVFDHIHLLDFKSIFKNSQSLEEINQKVGAYINTISSREIDVLLNLSFSKSSNYISSLIKAHNKLGTRFNSAHEVEVNDPWSQYLYSNVLGGSYNTFSLVDLFKNIIGNNFEHDHQIKSSSTGNILVHPFSSLERKNWKISKWKEIFYKLLKTNPNLNIKVAGSKDESSLILELLNDPILTQYKARIQNLVGKTSIEELYTHLKDSDYFIGHDSMVSHLAKVAGLPTLTFSLGSVRPEETVPYGPKSIVVSPRTNCFPCFPDEKCDFYQCHADISYQASFEVIQNFMSNSGEINVADIKEKISPFHLQSLNIQEAQVSKTGALYLKPVTEDFYSTKEVLKLFMRIAWQFKLNNTEENHPFPTLSKRTYQELFTLAQGLNYFKDLLIFGQKYSQEVLEELAKTEPSVELLQEKSQKIDEVDNLITLIKNAYPLLTSIIDYTNITKSNLQGNNLVELAEGSFFAYHNSASIVSIIYELLTNTLTEHKQFAASVSKTNER